MRSARECRSVQAPRVASPRHREIICHSQFAVVVCVRNMYVCRQEPHARYVKVKAYWRTVGNLAPGQLHLGHCDIEVCGVLGVLGVLYFRNSNSYRGGEKGPQGSGTKT
eukprot:955734-Prymnesium_polylepis.1